MTIRMNVEHTDLGSLAWGLIANAYDGDWNRAEKTNPGWKEAAEEWRDRYHAMIRQEMKDLSREPQNEESP
jgi:hypothetical protein